MAQSDKNKLFDALGNETDDPNLEITIIDANLTEDYETFGKMDLYVKFTLQDEDCQTEVAQDQGQNPYWNQDFKVFYEENDILYLYLWESDGGGSSDDYLGKLEINITQYLKQVDAGEKIQFKSDIKDKDDNNVVGYLNLSLQEILSQKQKDQKQQNQSEVLNQNLQLKKPQFVDVKPENLENKVNEIQQKLDNIQLKLRPQKDTAAHNNLNLHRAIVEGLQQIGKERPDNPVRELGLFLVNYNENK